MLIQEKAARATAIMGDRVFRNRMSDLPLGRVYFYLLFLGMVPLAAAALWSARRLSQTLALLRAALCFSCSCFDRSIRWWATTVRHSLMPFVYMAPRWERSQCLRCEQFPA